jgi:hypothetical protein
LPFGGWRSLLGSSCSRCGVGPSFRRSSGLLALGPDRNGVTAFRIRRGAAGAGAFSTAGPGCPSAGSGQQPAPWPDIAVGCHRGSGDLPVTQPRRRFTGVRPSRLSLARVHPDGFGLLLGFTRLLSHASLPGACAGREPTWTLIGAVGTQPTTTLQKRLSRRTTLAVIMAAVTLEMGSSIRGLQPTRGSR